jgi:hypothetical protein
MYQSTSPNIPQHLKFHYHRREDLVCHRICLVYGIKDSIVGHTIDSYSSQNILLLAVVNKYALQNAVFHHGSVVPTG